jgi:AraC-like DNA-binding protein
MAVNWLLDWLLEHGVSGSQLLANIGQRESGPTTFLDFHDYLRLFNHAADVLNEDKLGLLIGTRIDLRDYGFAGQLAHHSETLRDSWQVAEKYVATVSPAMGFKLTEGVEEGLIEYDVLSQPSAFCRQDVEMTLVSVVRFFRTYAGENWCPGRVSFKHDCPRETDAYADFFGVTVRFEQPVNSLAFAIEVLDTKVSATDPALLAVLRDHADSLLGELGRSDNLVAAVRYSIASTLGTELCNARDVAKGLFMSPRTLNRQLEKLGTSFRSLKQRVVEEVAKRALLGSRSSITDIALKLGYSETAAFDRAFKKITGRSPSCYRQVSWSTDSLGPPSGL